MAIKSDSYLTSLFGLEGKTIVVITHDEELAADWCDRVIQWNDKEERGR